MDFRNQMKERINKNQNHEILTFNLNLKLKDVVNKQFNFYLKNSKMQNDQKH
jgi:hypothetical protein